jgi:hypothetical protein
MIHRSAREEDHMLPSKVRELIRDAERTNSERDAMEREDGFASPDVNDASLLRTAMCALEAGMSQSDWPCVAEGYCMLVQLHKMVFGKDYDPAGS